jgi:hypothetical protein
MPVFKLIEEKQIRSKRVPPEMVVEYEQHIAQIKEGTIGQLEFGKYENMRFARTALHEAAHNLGIFIKVAKKRGERNILKIIKISREQYDAAKLIAQAKGERMREQMRGKKK